MTRFISTSAILVVGIFTAASAVAQFSVQTSATSNIAGGSGNATYSGTAATSSSFPGSGSITITNAPNTPNLTQATGQVIFTYPVTGGTVTGTAYASGNLATGAMSALGNGNQIGGTVTNEGVQVQMRDSLTFNIPGATSSTVTNIPVSFQVTGSSVGTGTSYGFTRNSGMTFGNGAITEGFDSTDKIIENGGWVSMQIVSLTQNLVTFNGVYAVTGPHPVVPVVLLLSVQCQSGDCDYSHGASFSMTLPAGVTYTSASGVFLTQPPSACNFALSSGGQVFPASGGSATLSVAVPAGCEWSVTNVPSWVAIAGAGNGIGNGSVNYNVQANAGADRTATMSVGGASFVVEELTPTISGLSFIGSMPHLAASDGWSTTITLVNKGTTAATARLNQFAEDGSPLLVPVSLPQQTTLTGPLIASSLDQTLAAGAQLVAQDIDQGIGTTQQLGSAQLNATGSVDGFAIFHYDPTEQEAVVPMETRNAPSYLLAFDNTGSVVTGIGIDNVSTSSANIPVTIRDDTGAVVATETVNLAANGHTSFVLSGQYPQTASIRGTMELDTPTGTQIGALGIRYTPPGTTTTIPTLAQVSNAGGLFAHLAAGGGWQTTFVLVNTGSTTAQASLAFFDKNGVALSLPLTVLETGTQSLSATYSQSIPPNASVWVQASAPLGSAESEGSAQLTTNGNVGGFEIFRYTPNGQEAVVPLESRNASGYFIAFDNTLGTTTGIAVGAISALANEIPVTLRDDQGNQLGFGGAFVLLPANGHTSFQLATQFPQTAGFRGTMEFDAPAGEQISVLGIRTPPPLTFTTLPALAK